MNFWRRVAFGSMGILVCLGQQSLGVWYEVCELRTFKATAYYSPEEGQDFYVQGSLEADKLLNGEGTHGASGKGVFNGMIAAPKSYTFGTRIYIPWRWIGQIEDRGWAIVVSGERNEPFDRLDIWAGKGEAWLAAALRFGVRYFDAYVCPTGVWWDNVWFDFSKIPLERDLPVTLREVDLFPGKMSNRTPILQRYLKTLWYMADVPESVYFGEATTRAVCAYQQAYMQMSADSEWCGWFGKKTRTSLRETLKSVVAADAWWVVAVAGQNQSVPQHDEEAMRALPIPQKWDKNEKQRADPARFFLPWGEFYGTLLWPLQPDDEGKEVRILQRKLQRLGHYPNDQEITGVYDKGTIRAIYAFQLAQGLLTDAVDPSAYGFFWPATRAKLNGL